MIAFSLPKKPNAYSFAQQSMVKPFYSNSNVSSNNTTVRESPAPTTANSDRNKCKQQGDKHENKPFKIRTFSTKVNHKKSVEEERIKMLKICAIETPNLDTDFIKNIKQNGALNSVGVLEDEPSHYITHTRKDLANMKRKKNANKQTSLFNQIQIFKRATKTSLMFRSLDFTTFDSLSHQPNIWLNQTNNAMEKQYLNTVLIISFRLLNMQTKKYDKIQANHQRMTDVSQNLPYSIQTSNCLKQLSDSQMSSQFLNQSKIFYKTNSLDELHELRSYLQQNNLTNFAGIIDSHNKYAQTYNFYNLRGITNKQSCVIVIDEQETLHTDIPVFHGENVLFLTPSPKNLTYFGITEMIKLIKQIEFETIKKEESSYIASKPYNQIPVDNVKENLHPNMANNVFASFGHQNRTVIMHSSPTKSKGQLFKHKLISLHSNTTMKFISLNMNDLQSRVNQSEEYKIIKKGLRHKRNTSLSFIQGQNQQNHNVKNRSTQKVIQKDTHRPCKVELDGEFKQKMIKYVKILENERIQRILQSKRIKTDQSVKIQRKDNQIDDLQELTSCLIQRLKTKTPFQLVGDILKNNAHIARQIGKYLDQTKLFHHQFSFTDKKDTFDINSCKNTLQLMLYQI